MSIYESLFGVGVINPNLLQKSEYEIARSGHMKDITFCI